jgi:superfamily II DNA/RNA helicase
VDESFNDATDSAAATPSPSWRRFEDLHLHPKSLKALRRQGLHNLTEIQEKTFDLILSGKDVVGRARTGTGKTLSFLLPAVERVTQKQATGAMPAGIPILILSPTRELAAQISKEAEWLVAQHGPELTSQVVYGGSSRREDIDRFNKQLPTILVATPGRLKDHLASTQLNGNKPFVDAFQNLQILVLDETDRLLDMGLGDQVKQIVQLIRANEASKSQPWWRSVLVSATVTPSVQALAKERILCGVQDWVWVKGGGDKSSKKTPESSSAIRDSAETAYVTDQ